jgi:hypothetical protein
LNENVAAGVARFINLSACRDEQYAYESNTNGYFTKFLIESFTENRSISLKSLMQTVGNKLVNVGLHQHPAFSFEGASNTSLEALLAIAIANFIQ